MLLIATAQVNAPVVDRAVSIGHPAVLRVLIPPAVELLASATAAAQPVCPNLRAVPDQDRERLLAGYAWREAVCDAVALEGPAHAGARPPAGAAAPALDRLPATGRRAPPGGGPSDLPGAAGVVARAGRPGPGGRRPPLAVG